MPFPEGRWCGLQAGQLRTTGLELHLYSLSVVSSFNRGSYDDIPFIQASVEKGISEYTSIKMFSTVEYISEKSGRHQSKWTHFGPTGNTRVFFEPDQRFRFRFRGTVVEY